MFWQRFNGAMALSMCASLDNGAARRFGVEFFSREFLAT
jgi:hypothetical protein